MPSGHPENYTSLTDVTYFDWKKKYAGLLPTEMKRLKKIVTDLTLDRKMLQDVTRRNEGPRSESFEAWPDARTCSQDLQRLGGVGPTGLWGHRVRPFDVSLPISSRRSGCSGEADPGDL